MIRVLVVDDSAFMRKVISRILEKDTSIKVIGTAEDGQQAIEKIAELKPDVVTLDVEMPRMNGIDALRHIMAHNPLPVIMLSGLTSEGAHITLDALNLGACDFIQKDLGAGTLGIFKIEEELIRKVKDVARKKVRSTSQRSADPPRRQVTLSAPGSPHREILALGASTGGPPVLQQILMSLPKDFPVPIAIAQHMPKLFTTSFAERLNNLSQISVKEAENREPLRPGVALIAPGDTHMVLRRRGREVFVEFVSDAKYIYRPSVDLLMTGVAQAFGARSIAVILTGMGNDGLAGFREIRAKNGFIIAQDEETCVVYGMPRAVVEAHLADVVLPAQKIPEEIIRAL
jgi:two-component system, chemotaxis family, protein-glutamate methylesterase/glutaminase